MTRRTGRGWMPDVEQKPAINVTRGRAGQSIAAAVVHIMDGSFWPSINWLTGKPSGTSAHFGVDDDGHIVQMVSIFDTAYANGLKWDQDGMFWRDAEGNPVAPAWPLLRPPINPNLTTISIEHAGRRGKVWTDAMYRADRRILEYIQSHVAISFVPHVTLIGHNEISPLLRAFCPGPGVDFDRIAASVQRGGGDDGSDVRVYRVLRQSNIRQSPEVRTGNVAGVARPGEIFRGRVVQGKAPRGSTDRRWVHRVEDQLGFLHIGQVEEVPVSAGA